MVNFLDYEGTDPVEASRTASESFTKAREASEGIKSFLFQASSVEEFDQRAEFDGVSDLLDQVADEYLGSPDQHAKLLSALRREFVAKGCESCPGGTKCVCDEDGCRCVKEAKVAEKETVHLDSGDVEIEKGKLTRDVGGKPSEHMDKVRELAENGNKGAQFYLNVLSSKGAFAVCPTCEGRGTHVNPSIDSQGLSAEDFAEDPDFEESYFAGDYDVSCAECGGNRVVPQCSADGCSNPADAKQDSPWSDRRDRVSTDHYPTCYDHHSDDDREEQESIGQSYAEQAAEMRMGA